MLEGKARQTNESIRHVLVLQYAHHCLDRERERESIEQFLNSGCVVTLCMACCKDERTPAYSVPDNPQDVWEDLVQEHHGLFIPEMKEEWFQQVEVLEKDELAPYLIQAFIWQQKPVAVLKGRKHQNGAAGLLHCLVQEQDRKEKMVAALGLPLLNPEDIHSWVAGNNQGAESNAKIKEKGIASAQDLFLTEKDIIRFIHDNRTGNMLKLKENQKLTPLARDYVREKQISIIWE